jgi:Spy/CpxP family protein refolding chaperone
MKQLALMATLLAVLAAAQPQAARQGPAGGGAGASPGTVGEAAAAGIPPGEIQRLFDAYALLQAQDQLRISGDQSLQFLARFKDLQDVRQKALTERTRRINALRVAVNRGQPDEAQLREQLKAIQDLDARATVDIKKAYDAIDQILDLTQQAKFRVFEENMERRKLELVTRARQANQANRGRR